ncbi:MAG TPA: hypothetical protein PK129_12210, partial [Cellvibrionaceae bacterium]|nr:hypothetical protein [Cellvibrionaceae bacterium]
MMSWLFPWLMASVHVALFARDGLGRGGCHPCRLASLPTGGKNRALGCGRLCEKLPAPGDKFTKGTGQG